MVYQVLNQTDLCDYYRFNKNPGISQRIKVRKDKFAFLDDEKIQLQLMTFRDLDRESKKNYKKIEIIFELI